MTDEPKTNTTEVLATILSMNQVIETIDERGGLGATLGFFESKDDAERFAKQRGWYGGNARIMPARILQVNGLNYVLDNKFPGPVSLETDLVSEAGRKLKEAQDAALANLTPEQRAMLGLRF